MANLIDGSRGVIPFHPFFIGLGGALLIAAAVTDAMYSSNSLMQWANFSTWLIAGGLVLALFAVVALLIDYTIGRAGPFRWLDLGLVAAAAILSLVNVFVHTRDAWTSVVPTGITISVVVAILLLVAGLRGWRVTAIKAPAGDDGR